MPATVAARFERFAVSGNGARPARGARRPPARSGRRPARRARTPGDAGLDLCALEALTSAGQRAKSAPGSPSRSRRATPGLVLPRSGLAAQHGISLVNAPGLIDAGYRGELHVLLLNTDRETAFEIAAATGSPSSCWCACELPATVEVDELRAGRGLRLER